MMDPAIGSRAAGMAAAVVANPSDPLSAVYYNSAGLAYIKGTNFEAGAAYAHFNLRYQNVQGYDERNSSKAIVPNFSYSTDSAAPIFISFGCYSTLGIGYKFKKDPSHGIASDIESSAGVLFLAPGIAYKLTPNLALGLQINMGYGITEAKRPVSGSVLDIETDGTGFGASISMIYKYSDSLNLGLSWRSAMHVTQEGKAKIGGNEYDLDVDIYNPQTLSVGVGYNFTSDLLVAISARWVDWSYFDKSTIMFNNLEQPFTRDSRDGIRYSLGCEYNVNDLITLRTGLFYDEYSIRKEWISPTLADATFYTFAIGSTFAIENIKIDMFLSWAPIKSIKVTNSQTGYPGKYEGYTYPFAGVDITYSF